MRLFREIYKTIRRIFLTIDTINRNKAVEYYEWEEKELRNTFALLVAGSFIGIPSPPVHITLELLPHIEEDLKIMIERMDASTDSIGEMFNLFDIG